MDHVVQGVEEVNVAFADGSTESGEVVGADPTTDLAVVRVDRDDLPAAKFAEDSDLTVGQLAVAIGSPSGFQSTVTRGVISGVNREVSADLSGQLGGCSGQPGRRARGYQRRLPAPQQTGAESIGFAIPSDTATSVADELIENGRVSDPFLGVRYRDLTPRIAERFGLSAESGMIVVEVEPDNSAADAGLRPEDVPTAPSGAPGSRTPPTSWALCATTSPATR